jgi:hypothetical protein
MAVTAPLVSLALAGCGSTATTRTQATHPTHPTTIARAKTKPKSSVAEECRKLIPTENPNAPDTTQSGCEYSLRQQTKMREREEACQAAIHSGPAAVERLPGCEAQMEREATHQPLGTRAEHTSSAEEAQHASEWTNEQRAVIVGDYANRGLSPALVECLVGKTERLYRPVEIEKESPKYEAAFAKEVGKEVAAQCGK